MENAEFQFTLLSKPIHRKVMDSFVQSGALRATINNVQLIELNTVRPLLPHTLDQIYRLEIAASDVARRRQHDTSTMSHTLTN